MIDERAGNDDGQPSTAAQARRLLLDGNRWFAGLGADAEARISRRHVIRLDAADIGLGELPGSAPAHRPFAVVLGCSDARVPAELILGRAAGDLFVVRIAGNVPGTWSVGSVDFAVGSLPSIRLLTVIGHTSCQAVGAAVDAYLAPASYVGVAGQLPLRAIVDSILPAVVCAAGALTEVYGERAAATPGYRTALAELSAIVNSALTAAVLRQTFSAHLGETLEVVYGLYNLSTRTVGLPGPAGPGDWVPSLVPPPQHEDDVGAMGRELAATAYISAALGGLGPAVMVFPDP